MSFLNKAGNGASMTNSIDLVCNSISLLQPDGSLQLLTLGGTVAPVNAPTFTGTVGGIDSASVVELALHTSQIAQNKNNISSFITSTNNTCASQLGLINVNANGLSSLVASTNNTFASQLGLLNVNANGLSSLITSTNNTFAAQLGLINGHTLSISNINSTISSQLPLLAPLTSLNKAGVGLGNVDNTTDLAKPASTATTAAITTAINNLVGTAPLVLDTLGEIATALGNNANLATQLTNSIATAQSTANAAQTTATAAQTALTTYQPRNTNLNNINNVITAPASYYISNFPPTDTVSWIGTAVNNAETITNAWGVVEHTAQMLTLTSTTLKDCLLYTSDAADE